MVKYSYDFKKKVVEAYLKGEGCAIYLSKKHIVPAHGNIQRWINAYKAFGDEGLMRSRKNNSYTFEFKLSVVELYLTTEVSYQELALKVGINNPPILTKWVNDYRIAGPDVLREKSKGRKPIVPKPKKIDNNQSSEYVKQLESDLLKLKIENSN